MERQVVEMSELDQLVQDELGKIESAKDFGVALWCQEPDKSGANWNAYLRRIACNGSSDTRWWDVVPKLRAEFNLNDQ